jgi:hypothetical protein
MVNVMKGGGRAPPTHTSLGKFYPQIGTQRVQMKGILPLLVRWALCAGTRDFCPNLTALVGPVQNIFFLIVCYFNSFIPIAQQAGQAALPGRLSLNMWL